MFLHQIRFRVNSTTVRVYNLTSWEDALFVAEAARHFRYPMVWWSRGAPSQPWSLRQRDRVTTKELKEDGSPFSLREPAPGEIGTLSGPSAGGGMRSSRSTPSTSSPNAGETGPGLEKP